MTKGRRLNYACLQYVTIPVLMYTDLANHFFYHQETLTFTVVLYTLITTFRGFFFRLSSLAPAA